MRKLANPENILYKSKEMDSLMGKDFMLTLPASTLPLGCQQKTLKPTTEELQLKRNQKNFC